MSDNKAYAVYEENNKGNIVKLIYVSDSFDRLTKAIIEKNNQKHYE